MATPTISIDVTKDLESFSALKTMLSSQQGAVFNIVGELVKYALTPVGETARLGAAATVSLTGTASWKVPSNGITFSLTPTASCSISISPASTPFAVAMRIDSAQTTKVGIGPAANTAYVNIDLDFDIKGSISGSGTFNGVGVAGKASGSKAATFSFCQPVDNALPTLDAVKKAFSQLVFPLDPKCAETMLPGSIAKASFDGAFDCELDVTYGLGSHQVSAPSVAKVQQSLGNIVKITPPSFEVSAGAKGSITYSHSDHFALLAIKNDEDTATLYLVRSAEADWGASVGVTAGVKATGASVTLDQATLQNTVQKVTGSGALAQAVASQVSQPANTLQSSLNARLKSWISDVTGQAGLTASLSRQSGHTALFAFQVNLAAASLAEQSWSALVGGSIRQALQLPGFTLLPGSGVSESLKRASTIQFQFFNLFAFTSTTDFFSNAYSELGPDGTIRIFRDLGQEQNAKTKHALSKYRIHFVASATEEALNHVDKAEVDLYLELSETGNRKAASAMANAIGLIPANASVQKAQGAMVSYVAAHPAGTLNLTTVIKRQAYEKLAATPYNGSKPSPLPHEQDQNNWKAFQIATEALIPDLSFVPGLTFRFWMDFNRAANDAVGSTMAPDRRNPGNWGGVPPSFFSSVGEDIRFLVEYFLLASAGFMNLCDDLHTLATVSQTVETSKQWNDVLNFLTDVINKDVFIDYAQPIAGALLYQSSIGGAKIDSRADLAQDSSSLTCTVTLA